MKTKIVIILCAVAFITQINQVNGESDPRLQSCIKKVITQFQKVRFDKLPNCFDADKLKQGKEDIAVFQTFYDTLPNECKKPNKQNIGQCLKTISQNINSKSDDMKAGIINSVHSFFMGGKDCFDNAKNVFANLDKYILNGCQ